MMKRPFARSGFGSRSQQRGLTLLELMVAMVISLIVTLAALAALLFSREGFSTIDSSSQLRENSRFLSELLSRVVVQAGYRSTTSGPISRSTRWYAQQVPDVEGFDNSVTTAAVTANPIATGSVVARSASTCASSDTSCVNGSDILVVRFQGENKPDGSADDSMINCSGDTQPHSVANQNLSDSTNVFYVTRSASLEPVLMCATLNAATGAWSAQPLISGVESFQVLYGTQGVTPNVAVAAPTANTAAAVPVPEPPDRWLRADQIVVPSDTAGTQRNWRRVTDIRIGLVLRGLPSQGATQAKTVYPFSEGAGSPFAVSADVGSALAVPADRRLRQTVTFNVHLRNTLN